MVQVSKMVWLLMTVTSQNSVVVWLRVMVWISKTVLLGRVG
jgi:hypothetical protein